MGTCEKSAVAVVDDDAAVRDSLRFLLETTGYRVETYGSGMEFLAKANPGRLGCLVVDQRMPQLSGLGLIERLRRDGIAIPALLITGAASLPLARQVTALGIRMLEKPLLDDDILACIEGALA